MNDTNPKQLETHETLPVISTPSKDIRTELGLKSLIIDKYINSLPDEELQKKYSVGRATIYRYLKSQDAYKIRYKLIPADFKGVMASQWHDVFHDMLPVVEEKIKRVVEHGDKVSLSEIGTIMGIATDKINVLAGQPTDIVAYADMSQSLEEIQAQRQALMQELGFDPEDDEEVMDAEVISPKEEQDRS